MMNIQSLTLMAMVVLVFGNPLSQKEKNVLLREIIEEVQNLTSKNLTCHVYDQKGNGGSTCVTDFFCLAEKVLKHFPPEKRTRRHQRNLNPHCDKKSEHEAVKNLTRVLHQYNKGRENCTLKTNGTCQLSKFLEDVEICAKSCLDNPNDCKNH